jgi:hypothetical protein
LCIALDSNGNVVVGGNRHESATSTDTDFAVAKLNSDGTLAWMRTYASAAGAYAEGAYDICVDSQDAIIATGYRVSATLSYLTVKWDSAGVRKWAKVHDVAAGWADQAYWISADSSGDVYVGGRSSGPYSPSTSDNQSAVIKYRGSDGLKLWEYVYLGSQNSTYDTYAGDPVPDNAGNVFICGYVDGIPFVAKLNAANGSHLWTRSVPITGSVLANLYQIRLGAGDELYAAGWWRLQGSSATNPDSDFTAKITKSTGALSWTNTSVAVRAITSNGQLLGMSPQSDDFYNIGIGIAQVDPVTGSTLWALGTEPPVGMGASPRGFLTIDGAGNAYVIGTLYQGTSPWTQVGTFFARFGIEP